MCSRLRWIGISSAKAVLVDFFGAPARLPQGAVELARRTGAAIVPIFGLRLPKHRYRMIVEPPFVMSDGHL